MQPELCLTLNEGNRTQLALKVTLEEVILRCQREKLYFTRNTQVKVQYRKRCPHMGTCTGKKCEKIKQESLIEELDVANNFTGITYCTESCGGLGCSVASLPQGVYSTEFTTLLWMKRYSKYFNAPRGTKW